MQGETVRLTKELLIWQEHLRTTKKNDTVALRDLLPYKKLCERAEMPAATRIVGGFLGELAAWCKANDLPPLNSIAVNSESLIPGMGYDRAEGCSYNTWWEDVLACVRTKYPQRIP